MNPDTVDLMDQHWEQRGTSTTLVLHRFYCRLMATQSLLSVDTLGVVLVGDRFAHERGPDHDSPKSGSFVTPPTKRGEWKKAGQDLLFVDGRAAVTMAGELTRCDDVTPTAPARRAVVVGDSD